MANSKEVLEELLKGYKSPEELTGPEGLLKQLAKALIERTMDAEITEHVGYEKNEQAEKDTIVCRFEFCRLHKIAYMAKY
ncbi:MAG: hypothetical protein SAMD01599839_11680 [Rectinema sp.]